VPWVEREIPWHHVQVEYCDVTGQLLPRRYWSFEAAGRTLRTTDPRYEALYREHLEAAGDEAPTA
jgi:hypothetical protein